MEIIKFISCLLIALLFTYIFLRLITLAITKSLFQVLIKFINEQKENENGAKTKR